MAFFNRVFLTVAWTCACALFAFVPASSGQVASFSFNDQDGPADAGSYPAGTSFTFSVNFAFGPGGNINNLYGFSYWFEQQSPLPPFYFAITNRNFTGSQFTAFGGSQTYPQNLTPASPSDLGASLPGPTGLGAGNYFIANISVSISPSAAPGTYILKNTTSGGKTSVITDDQGDTVSIGPTSYTVTVVPFNISSISRMDNNIVLQCNGVPNHINRIEASPDLSPNSFQTIGSVTPDSSGTFAFTDPNPGAQQFYRLAFP
jgi:hypothetical protein